MTATTTRQVLHRVGAHVVGRRRFEVSGRFGLRASPGGFASPAFGDGPEVVRVAGTLLIREVAGDATTMPIPGASLRAMARFAGTDLNVPFSAGDDTPELGDSDAAVELDEAVTHQIADWFDLAWRVLDDVVGGTSEQTGGGAIDSRRTEAGPATIQLWPEHFDVGTNIGLPSGDRINLGFSPGDGYEPAPYVYVGPQGSERRGDADFWNAPFGAVLRSSELPAAREGAGPKCTEFLRTGIANASSPS
jgi:hypothetical protein